MCHFLEITQLYVRKRKDQGGNPREEFHSIAKTFVLTSAKRGMDVLHFTLNHWVVFYVVFSHFYSHTILRLMPHQWKRGSLFQTYKNNGHSTVANIHYGLSYCLTAFTISLVKVFLLLSALFVFFNLSTG